MKLISREKVLDYLQSEIHFWEDEGEKACIVLEIAKFEIEELPIIESRQKGKWVNRQRCSECGHIPLLKPYMKIYEDEETKEILAYNYCPNCGADMRGEE